MKAASRREYTPATAKIYAIARAATFFELAHIPRKGITSKQIADKYALGEIWYEYENSPRRVNMSEQLVRNELNKAFKERRVVKMWNSRTGKLIKRDGYIVYFKPDMFPMRQVEYGQQLPDGRWFH